MEAWKSKVDVIIPTYKPDEKFDRLLRMLEKQTLKPNEIHVIDTIPTGTKTTDVTPRCAQYANIKVTEIPQSEFNHGGTRNMGVEMSDAEFVVMMTQDAVPADEKMLEELIKPFQKEEVAVSFARQLATEEVGIIEHYTRVFNYPDKPLEKTKKDIDRLGIKAYFCSDVCAAYRREKYMELGGFVTKTIFNEDTIMASKILDAGYSVYYAADAKVYHAHKYTGKQQFQRNFDLGVSHREYREIFDRVKAEGEGMNLVKNTAKYLMKKGKPWLIITLIWSSGCKFLGYRFGKKYDRLPKWFVRACSSQKSYWK